MRQLVILALLLIAVSSNPMHKKMMSAIADQPTKEQFKIWHYIFSKEAEYQLNSQQALNKYKNFRDNLAYIKQRNSEQSGFKLGLGPFSDLSYTEFKNQHLNMKVENKEESKLFLNFNDSHPNIRSNTTKPNIKKAKTFDELADELDKTNRRNLNDCDNNNDNNNDDNNNDNNGTTYFANHRNLWNYVFNQQSCGSCWACATVGVVEGMTKKQHFHNDTSKFTTKLSVQQLVDCDNSNGGCGGGWFTGALDYVKANGLVSLESYPYQNTKSTCQLNQNFFGDDCNNNNDNNNNNDSKGPKVKITEYDMCQGNCTTEKIESMIRNGPFAAAYDCNSDCQHYSSGVLDYKCNGVNHGVVVVAMSNTELVYRNSWGSNYGDNGHARVKRRTSDKTCSFEKYAYQPTNTKLLN